jgi:hypothetical protein
MMKSISAGALAATLLAGGMQAQRTATPQAATTKPLGDQVVITPAPARAAPSTTERPGDGDAPLPTASDISNPILGHWRWSSKDGRCLEQHEFRADGTATIRSGDEVLEKTYTIERYEGGPYYLFRERVTASNGRKDCTGQTTAVGKQSGMFVLPTNDGGFYTCSSNEGWGCFGTAIRAQRPLPSTSAGGERQGRTDERGGDAETDDR